MKLPDPSTDSVTVTANQVGTLDQNGIYRTVQQADSGIQRSFGMKRVNGQWRIDKLSSPGLLIQLSDFVALPHAPALLLRPHARNTSFPIPATRRWPTNRSRPGCSISFCRQPRPELQLAVLSIPNAVNAKNATVTVDATSQLYVVELPGSSRLDPDSRRRLAAQVAFTFNNALDHDYGQPSAGVDTWHHRTIRETDFQSASGVFHDRPAFYVNDAGMVARPDRQSTRRTSRSPVVRPHLDFSRRRSGRFRSPGGGRRWIDGPVDPADWVAQGRSA